MNPPTRFEHPAGPHSYSSNTKISAQRPRRRGRADPGLPPSSDRGSAVFWQKVRSSTSPAVLDQGTTDQHVYDGAKTIIEYSKGA